MHINLINKKNVCMYVIIRIHIYLHLTFSFIKSLTNSIWKPSSTTSDNIVASTWLANRSGLRLGLRSRREGFACSVAKYDIWIACALSHTCNKGKCDQILIQCETLINAYSRFYLLTIHSIFYRIIPNILDYIKF